MTRLEHIVELSADPETLLERRPVNGDMEIREHGDLRWLFTGGTSVAAAMRINAPESLVLPTHVAMLTALLLTEKPIAKILNLGCGCGTLERLLWHHRPDIAVTSVDISQDMIDIAQRYFHMPKTWPVAIESAETYLQTHDRHIDVIFCDLFADNRHAPCLTRDSVFESMAERLTSNGVIAVNLAPLDQRELLDVLLPARRYFNSVMLLRVAEYANLVLLAFQHRPPAPMSLAASARQWSTWLQTELGHLPQQLELLPPWR